MTWRDLFSTRATRRELLRGGALGAAAAILPLDLHAVQRKAGARVPFTPLLPWSADDFRVADGYQNQVVVPHSYHSVPFILATIFATSM